MRDRLGSYELIELIGQGGMAQVWRGVRESQVGAARKPVAIKLVAEHRSRSIEYRRLLLREARLSMLLNHSNIVQVFDVDEADGRVYMAMEWIDGLSLDELQKRVAAAGRRIGDGIAAFIVAELLKALNHAHEHRPSAIVHRDISPHNIMISRAGEVKVADFGIARLVDEDTSGVIKGKLKYMAPEQLLGDGRLPTVDLFAAGAVLFELLEGKPFRIAQDEPELYGLAVRGEHAAAERDDVPAVLERLREGLLQPEPSRRIRSARLALQRLHEWERFTDASLALGRLVCELEGERGDRGTNVELEPPALPRLVEAGGSVRRRGARRWIVAGLGLVLTMAAIAWLIGRRGNVSVDPRPFTVVDQRSAEPEPQELAAKPEPVGEQIRPEPVPSAVPSEQPPPSPSTPPVRQRAAKPATVKFEANEYSSVHVLVGDRELLLDPSLEIQLPSGKHRLSFRRHESDDWRPIAAALEVDSGGEYVVRMRREGRVSVIRR